MEQSRKIKLSCKGLGKTFKTPKGDFEVLRDLTFDVYENDFSSSSGRVGAARPRCSICWPVWNPATARFSTTAKTVEMPEPSRAMVYQTMALFPWMTVMDNVAFSQKVKKIPKKERAQIAQKFIDLVGLTGFEKSFPIQLSGGMKQRVGIARAYCSDPDVLLMDEPFGHLDAQTRYMMQESIEEIWEKEKRTVVFVTNNIEEALYLADRIILLSDCPSQIRAEYKIDLPRPRDLVSPEFMRLRKEITERMNSAVY